MTGGTSVTALLQKDHERLDAIVEELERDVAKGSFREARERVAAFASGLRRHIEVEEQILFPSFEAATGMKGHGPTAVMRREHLDIHRLLDDMEAALERANAAAFGEIAGALTAMLGEHNRKEEQILYPMMDRVLGAGAEPVVGRLRAGLGQPT